MKKTIVAVIALLALVSAFTVSAFAATGISAEEQKLLDKFKEGVTLADGTHVDTPASYITQAENELAKKDLTADEIKTLSDCIDTVYAKIKSENLHSLSEIKNSKSYDEIVKTIQTAAKEVGYTVSPTDPNGVGAEIKPNQTGADMTATIVTVIALVGLLTASFVVIGKKKMLVK